MNQCSRCGETKPPEAFHVNVTKPGRRDQTCRICVRAQRKGRHTVGKKLVRDPIKERARGRVRDAVRHGKLTKPDNCSRCRTKTPRHLLDAHHTAGYENPLTIEWLCRQCHEGD